MSRIARKPLMIPANVEVKQENDLLFVKGKQGKFEFKLPALVSVILEDNSIKIISDNKEIVGTTVVLIKNILTGVSQGFSRALQLVGVGYRAKVQNNVLELSLGFSHSVIYKPTEGISIEAPSNTEIIIKGASKEKVGQTAAEIRALRSPEVYKGKGIRYSDEKIILKEIKKK